MSQATAPEAPTIQSSANFIGLNINQLRVNSTLREDEWEAIDAALIPAAVAPLRATQDLIDAGLVRDLRARGFGATVDLFDRVSKMSDADVQMDTATNLSEDIVAYDRQGVPLPVIGKAFRFSLRQLEASRQLGDPVDVDAGEAAARVIGESLENLVVNGERMDGTQVTIAGHTIHGYTSHPDRNEGNLTGGGWNESGGDPLQDTLDMLSDAETAKHFGPFWLYVPSTYSGALDDDYKAESERTLQQRLEAIDRIQGVRVLDKLPDNNVVLVEATRRTVDLVIAVDPITFPEEISGGLSMRMHVVQVAAPRLKSDYDGNMGLVHYTP